MAYSYAMSTTAPIPVLNQQATGQVAGGQFPLSATPSPFSGTISMGNATTSSFITSGSTTGYVVVNQARPYRKPRKPREKRHVPLYTAGLEAKLNKTLDKDASKIIRYITKKVNMDPVVDSTISEDIYEFSVVLQYGTQTGVAWGNTNPLPQLDQHTVKFYAKLYVRHTGTLREYEIRMSGAKA